MWGIFFYLFWLYNSMLSDIQKQQLLYDIFDAYEVMKLGKTNKQTMISFDINKEKEILCLYNDLVDWTYHTSSYTCFLIYDPVPREIFAPHIRDRIVHHFVYQQLNPILENLFLPNSYACRKEKWTHYGIHQVKKMLRSVSDNYTQEARVAKYDISSYFMSIHKNTLCSLVLAIMKNNISSLAYPLERLRNIIETIIVDDPTTHYHRIGDKKRRKHFPQKKSLFMSKKWFWLPLGNLTSQVFANIYLHQLDVFVTQTLGIQHYWRYMDDFVLIHRDKEYLQQCAKHIEIFLQDTLQLQLHPNKRYFQPIKHWIIFCGVRIHPYYILPSKRTIGRRKKKIHTRIAHPPTSYTAWEHFRSTYNSYIGMMKHWSSYRLRKQLFCLLPVHRHNSIIYSYPFGKIILKTKKIKKKFKKTLYIFYKLFGW